MHIYERISEIVKGRKDVVFFEFGCCDGHNTKAIVNLLPQGYRYYAFEPDARRQHGLNTKPGVWDKVTIVPKAVGSIDGEARFYISSQNYYGSSSLRKPTDCLKRWFPTMTFTEGQVDVVTMDTFCREAGIYHIDFIWADVQGCEIDMIEGGRLMLERTDYLYTEYTDSPFYEGNIGLKGIIGLLPGWSVVEDYKGDVLLKNCYKFPQKDVCDKCAGFKKKECTFYKKEDWPGIWLANECGRFERKEVG